MKKLWGNQKPGTAMSDADILVALDSWLSDGEAPTVNNEAFAVLTVPSQAASNDSAGVTKPVTTEIAPNSVIDARVSRDDSLTNLTQALKAKGIPAQSADALASRLVQRDRQLDDRRSCAECLSFQDGNCLQRISPIGETTIHTLHRCKGFQEGLRHRGHCNDVDNSG